MMATTLIAITTLIAMTTLISIKNDFLFKFLAHGSLLTNSVTLSIQSDDVITQNNNITNWIYLHSYPSSELMLQNPTT
jgi:hypothetical protein